MGFYPRVNTASTIFDTNLETFEWDVINASQEIPLLVDFWADWCAPCIAIAPILEQVIPTYQGKLRLARLEVDAGENMKLAGQYQVRGFPTIILFQGGVETARFSGVRSASHVQDFINEHTQLSVAP